MSWNCFLTFIIILLRTPALLKSKSKVSSGSCVWILQSVNTPPSSNLQMNSTCKIFILVGITREVNLCLTRHKLSLIVSSLISCGRCAWGRWEGEKEGDDWQFTFPVPFFSLSFPLIPSPRCCSNSLLQLLAWPLLNYSSSAISLSRNAWNFLPLCLPPPKQHNLVPRASWLPSFLLAIILHYWHHFLNITIVLQIWLMLL